MRDFLGFLDAGVPKTIITNANARQLRHPSEANTQVDYCPEIERIAKILAFFTHFP
jgi:hypothetical protein